MLQSYCPRCGGMIPEAEMRYCPDCGREQPGSGRWPLDPLLGTLVDHGKYKVDKLLGRGGFGRVYVVHHTLLPDQRFAMKVLNAAEAGEPDAQESFLREVRVMMELHHANIVRCHDVGQLPDGALFIRMELVEGRGLQTMIKAPTHLMGPKRATRIGLQIADALVEAHRRQVLHRDLKPENILVMVDDEVRIIDFGIAKAVGTRSALSQVIGTPLFMAPEQFNVGSEVDGRLDVYQLGAVLHFVLTGHPPYQVGSSSNVQQDVIALFTQQQARRGLGGPPPSLLRPEVGEAAPELDALVGRMLSTEVTARPNAAEVRQALRAMIEPQRPYTAQPSVQIVPAIMDSGARVIEATAPTSALAAPQPPTMIHPQETTLAVLLFENRSGEEDAYLAEGLTEDLIDLLSMAGGLKVRPIGVVLSMCQSCTQDPRELGRRLEVEVVVGGAIERRGERITIRARAVNVTDGFVQWAGRFQGDTGEVFSLTEQIAEAIARALNTEARTPPGHELAPDTGVVDLYLRARHAMRQGWYGDMEPAIALFNQAMAVAPQDPLVVAGAAVSFARVAFNRGGSDEVEAARALAPGRFEPLYAMALTDFISGLPAASLARLHQARQIAPDHPDLHDLLGRIMVETGPLEEGIEHLKRALALDPTFSSTRIDLMRALVLAGRWDEAVALLQYPVGNADDRLLMAFSTARMGLWRSDPSVVRQIDPELLQGDTVSMGVRAFISVLERGFIPPEFETRIESFLADIANPRRRTAILQFITEMLVFVGRHDEALQMLEQACLAGLFDRMWLDHCPALVPIREEPAFVRLRERVEAVLVGTRIPSVRFS